MKTSLKNLLDKSNNTIYSFVDDFNAIIERKIDGYDGLTDTQLNDLLWHDADWVFEQLGISEEEED